MMERTKPQAEMPKKDKNPRRRILIDWAVIIGIFLIITQTPFGTTVQSVLQRGILWTGILQPEISLSEDEIVPANYSIPIVRLDGEPASLEGLRGKVLFINVWATWCAPCIAEMPFIQELYEQLGSESVEFVMISTDDSIDQAKAFIEAKGFTFPVYYLTGPMPRPYTSSMIPTTYVVSADGNVVAVNAGMANYDSARFKNFLIALSESVERTL